jgi:hypothetical protein
MNVTSISGNRTLNVRNKPIWVFPWQYREALLVALALLIVGIMLEWATGGNGLSVPSWPGNLYMGLGLAGSVTALQVLGRRNPIVHWLGRVPAAMGSIVLITFLVMIMGLVLQDDPNPPALVERLNLHRMTSGWPFMLAMTFFLTTLGLATLRRLRPFTAKNTGFFLNHFGLWLAITAGILGAGDLERVRMALYTGELTWEGTNLKGEVVEMPLALELHEFEMTEFDPKVGIFDLEGGRLVSSGTTSLMDMGVVSSGFVGDWEVNVVEYHVDAFFFGDKYVPMDHFGAAPAALIEAVNRSTGQAVKGWVSTGSFATDHAIIQISENKAFAMTMPQASLFRSHVNLYTKSGRDEHVEIEVNKPVRAEGWLLYQYSYDDRFGKWSQASVIEAIRDPWLPVVYTGIFMLLLGSVYIMYTGQRDRKPEDSDEVNPPSAEQPPVGLSETILTVDTDVVYEPLEPVAEELT